MYQTVGHDAVHAVAQALQLPLYRAEIAGRAVNQEAVYGARVPHASGSVAPADDETEDLYRLLKHVQQHHPDIEGVSVGAILSNYQRVRVEHVYVVGAVAPIADAAHAAPTCSGRRWPSYGSATRPTS